MPRYVRVLDTAVGTPKVADTLAEWVDVNDLIEVQEGAVGITNNAPVGAIPVTSDVDGNLTGSAALSAELVVGTTVLHLENTEEGHALIKGNGAGVEITLQAADGDENIPGGEVTIQSGGSIGNEGGQILITTGPDSGGGNSGSIKLFTGAASDGEGNGGSTGDIDIRVGGSGGIADFKGGGVLIQSGSGVFGGGNISLDAGSRTGESGNHGKIQAIGGDNVQGFEINSSAMNINDKLMVAGDVGFYGTAPVARPNIDLTPTAQEIVDVLVLLGLVTQS
jgi:hypothetical protein